MLDEVNCVEYPSSMSRSTHVNLFGAEFKACPFGTYAHLRATDPLHRRISQDGTTTIHFITRHNHVAALLRDRRLVKNVDAVLDQLTATHQPDIMRLLSNHMLNMDPPDHTRVRGLVNQIFTAKRVAKLEPRIQAIADQLLDRVQEQGQMDLIDDYAFPLPITVICELLGIPARDRNRFRHWSHAFVTSSANITRSQKKFRKTKRLMEDFIRYMTKLFDERRRQPQDDLITSLLQVEEAGDRLSQEELYSMIILLVVAGHETMVNLIGNGVLALLTHPAELNKLRVNPELMATAIQELIRYDGPVERAMMRFAADDIAFDEGTIQRGDVVSLVLSAANRDPAVFPDPDRLELERDASRHVGFGGGIHYCLGAPLARIEARIAIEMLLRRLPNLRLAVPIDELRWRTVPVIRGMYHLPVAWDTEK